MGRFRDLTGESFGRLTVISDTSYRAVGNGSSIWNCQCDCGNFTNVSASNLTTGKTKSCGCLQIEHVRELGKSKITHGTSHTPEYYTWHAMIKRCTNSKDPNYYNYGGRGITVCDRWRHSFENFLADMGPRPSDDHSLDRKENDGNYEPNNCKWSTRVEQCNNKRTNVFITYKDKQYTVASLARETNMNESTLISRLKRGWSIERAVETSVNTMFYPKIIIIDTKSLIEDYETDMRAIGAVDVFELQKLITITIQTISNSKQPLTVDGNNIINYTISNNYSETVVEINNIFTTGLVNKLKEIGVITDKVFNYYYDSLLGMDIILRKLPLS